MDKILAIFFGAVQGITEFLPISSSGHLYVLHELLRWDNGSLTFDVALHAGTFVAVLIYFFRDWGNLAKGFLESFKTFPQFATSEQLLAWSVVISSIPAIVVGAIFSAWIETVARNMIIVALAFMLIGGLMIAVEHIFRNNSRTTLTFRDAVVMGMTQVLAFIPGVSRSGITIITGMSQGLQRSAAARFSFLMSAPVIFGAMSERVWEMDQQNVSLEGMIFILGVVSAALTGILAIHVLLKFVSRHSLEIFAYYRIVVGVVLIGLVLTSVL